MTYRRIPTRVNAELLDADWEWVTANGDRMLARTGDYRVTDPVTGARWSISRDALTESYVALGNGVYESGGTVDARRVAENQRPERVLSSEGVEEARPGDWILRSESGAQWVVTDTWFGAHYLPVS